MYRAPSSKQRANRRSKNNVLIPVKLKHLGDDDEQPRFRNCNIMTPPESQIHNWHKGDSRLNLAHGLDVNSFKHALVL